MGQPIQSNHIDLDDGYLASLSLPLLLKTTRAVLAFVAKIMRMKDWYIVDVQGCISDNSGAVSAPPGVGKTMMGRVEGETAWAKGQRR